MNPRLVAGRLLSVLLCVLPVLVVTVMGWRRRWVSDDGFINLRVVDQVLAGNGPVFNLGERVEVATSTLWLWLLVAGDALTPGIESGVVAVVLGVALTGVGIGIGIDAARRLWRVVDPSPDNVPGLVVPLAAIAFVVLPPVWDFATSGLETGLTFAWLGTSQWLLVRAISSPRLPVAAAAVIGLGPLVRPDLTLVAACLGLALVLQRFRLRRILALAGIALALPLAWQVFRAGYYASLVPNTALAKSFGDSDPARGWVYLVDFVARYAVWFPLMIGLGVTTWLVMSVVTDTEGRQRVARTAAILAPVVGGLLHAGYVVRLGGDFMHARMLLPATFAMLLPAFAVVIPYGRRADRSAALLLAGLVVGTVVWAGPVSTVRTPYQLYPDPASGIANERSYYRLRSATKRLVLVEDLRGIDLDSLGRRLRADREAGKGYYFEGDWHHMPPEGFHAPAVPGRVAIAQSSLGIIGVVGGREVFIADTVGLSDAIGARVAAPEGDAGVDRTGHRERPAVWRLARYAAPSPADAADVVAAREALRCGDLARLQTAITAPMTPQRFWENLWAAPRLTALEIPADPVAARDQFC